MKKLLLISLTVILFTACKKSTSIPDKRVIVATSFTLPYNLKIDAGSATVLDTSFTTGGIEYIFTTPASNAVHVEVAYSDTAKTLPVVGITVNKITDTAKTVTTANGIKTWAFTIPAK
jgi:hypothetical protein